MVPTDSPSSPSPVTPGGPGSDLGIMMGGGGARAAYQVGFLKHVARRHPELSIPYVTGVSAGAINAAHMAAHHGRFEQAVSELVSLWSNLHVDDVFRVDPASLGKNVLRWGARLAFGTGRIHEQTRMALLETDPLRRYLTEVLHAVDGELTGISYNLARGRLKAVALSTASYTTGQSVTFVQGKDIELWERPNRISVKTVLTVEHVMASASIPIFFPAVRLGSAWYGDGGMRLVAPLSPILHLGADRIIAISTRYDRSGREAETPQIEGYPPPAQVLGVLMNSVFLDLLDQDAFRLERINQLVERLPAGERDGLRPIRLLMVRPSTDLGRLAKEYEADLPKAFRFLTRNLGTRRTVSPDSLSLLLFQPSYLKRLIEIGEQDAEARSDEIDAFLAESAPQGALAAS